MKLKDLIVVLSVAIFSIVYIVIGYNYTTKNMEFSLSEGDNIAFKAKVLEITDINEEILNFGDVDVINKTIYFSAKIKNGDLKGEIVEGKQAKNGFFAIEPEEIEVGDSILISYDVNQMTGEYIEDMFLMLEYSRMDTIIWIVAIFFVFLLIFGALKGILTILSLVFTCSSIFLVLIPGILAGYNIYILSILTCVFIISMTLLLVNGFNLKSLSAGIGCIGGILLSGLIALFLNSTLKLTGMVDDQSVLLSLLNENRPIDLKAIVFGAIIIGSVGAIMDVSISIASSLNEIKLQKPSISKVDLMKSGIEIGRDIMGTMTNTLILAYIGGSLSVVLLLLSSTSSLVYLTNTEMIVVELLQAVVGSLGILITLPLTSLISAILFTNVE